VVDAAGMVASSLCAPLLDGAATSFRVAHASASAWQLADDRGRVVASLVTPTAVRLPTSLVVPRLGQPISEVVIGGGVLSLGGLRLRPVRWFSPARPWLPALRSRLRSAARLERHVAGWRRLLGGGPGLTPYGDDVLCGTIVALVAAGDPLGDRLSEQLRAQPLERLTTATSAGLLRLAADGWCIDPLARLLSALADRREPLPAGRELAAVGASSGQGLLEGVGAVVDLGLHVDGVAA
jgi:Protein of unknown function (DUF2877)